jgi:predicted Zn-dependent protease
VEVGSRLAELVWGRAPSPVLRSEAAQKIQPMMLVLIVFLSTFAVPQTPPMRPQLTPTQNPSLQTESPETNDVDQQAEKELQTGSALTRRGEFTQAIPYLLAARGRVANDYAAEFNLSICYVATGQPRHAIPLLTQLRSSGHDNADVNNLLAQAYVGDSQDEKALDALKRAATLTHGNERLYMFVADACMGKQAYALGLEVVEVGLKNLPDSAQLHLERGMFLTLMDRFDDAKGDFELARKLAPDSEVAYIAGAEEAMYGGNVAEAVRISREGIAKGHNNFLLLTLFGEASLRSGITPGQKEFDEARQALEAAVSERPNYSSSQLALGKLYLLNGQTADAIVHLEEARALSPGNAAVYSNLAAAYRKQGEMQKAQDALAKLAELNQAQAERIRTAPGETKSSYTGAAPQPH